MTFQEFQASRFETKDLSKHIDDTCWDDYADPQAGFVYCGDLCIEMVSPNHAEWAQARGKYYLLIDRNEFVSNNLEELESTLYCWAVEAGFCV